MHTAVKLGGWLSHKFDKPARRRAMQEESCCCGSCQAAVLSFSQ